jgi:hypothetical protein
VVFDPDPAHLGAGAGDVPEVDPRPAAHVEHPASSPPSDQVNEERAEDRFGHA